MHLRYPAEWEPHAATWTAWPFDDEEWRGYLAPAREEYAAFLRRLSHFEPVELLVADDEAEQDAKSRLEGCNVRFHPCQLDDVWFRDNGPIFIKRDDGKVTLTHWRFNAWGNKYDWALDAQAPVTVASILNARRKEVPYVMEGGSLETNGRGLCLTTRQCLLHPERNPQLDAAQLQHALRKFLGIDQVIWLERGLEGDHTDGHIDTLTRFVGPKRVVTSMCGPEDANYEVLLENYHQLEHYGLEVVKLPLPRERREIKGVRLPMTYANFYIANGIVLVPTYGDPNDEKALEVLAKEFPDRRVEGLSAAAIITSGGAFHCLTQQQPEGPLAQ